MRRFATLTTILFAASFAFAQPKGPAPKSKAEITAINAMLSAQDPDSRIKAAEELITKFADTTYKSLALSMEADAYSQKGDNDKAIVYGEQSVDADPTTYQASVLVAKSYAATTHYNDLDKAEKIAKIDKYAKMAIDSLGAAQKPNPKLTDDQWMQAKNALMGEAYFSMGVSAVYANKLDDAKANFDKAAPIDADPADMVRAARAFMDAKKYQDAATYYGKAMSAPNMPDNIKKIAESEKASADKMIKK